MKAVDGKEVRRKPYAVPQTPRVPGLDEQFIGLIETVYGCERRWSIEDRIEAAMSYRGETK